MSTELDRSLQKFELDTKRLVDLIPNPIVRPLVGAVVGRLVFILSQLITEKTKNG